MKNIYKVRIFISSVIIILSLLAFFGVFYGVKVFDIQLAALVQRTITDFTWVALFLLALILILTFVFGRFYCSVICPLGIIQELVSFLSREKNTALKINAPIKYYIAAVFFGCIIGGSVIFARYIDPYTIFGSGITLSKIGIILLFVVLLVALTKRRFFCTNICPVGAVLGSISKCSYNKIYINTEKCVSCGMCEKSCQSGCINVEDKSVENETCIKCLKCFSTCKKGAIQYGKRPVKFSIKRRELIIAASTLIVFGGAIKTGLELSKNFVKKVADIILPAGAGEPNRMTNKCLNCNLCIENCPNKILTKANNDFSAVHIDYTKGKGYCKYNCKKCSEVCPSGAIKKITLEEKQHTRIAMAIINEEKCKQCGACAIDCPAGAIAQIDGKIVLDGTKCIGCARCTKSCQFDAIEIFAVNEQRRI